VRFNARVIHENVADFGERDATVWLSVAFEMTFGREIRQQLVLAVEHEEALPPLVVRLLAQFIETSGTRVGRQSHFRSRTQVVSQFADVLL